MLRQLAMTSVLALGLMVNGVANAMTVEEFTQLNNDLKAKVRTEKTSDKFGRAVEGLRGIYGIAPFVEGKTYLINSVFKPTLNIKCDVGGGIPQKVVLAFENDINEVTTIDCSIDSYYTQRIYNWSFYDATFIVPLVPKNCKFVGGMLHTAGYKPRSIVNTKKEKDMESFNTYLRKISDVQFADIKNLQYLADKE